MTLWLPPSADRKTPDLGGALGMCACCRERGGERKLTFVRGGLVDGHNIPTVTVRAILCRRCQANGPDEGNSFPTARHQAGFCIACGRKAGIFWHCSFVDHVAQVHPSLMEKLINDPYEEIADVPRPEIIGTVEVETRDAEFPKKFW